MANKRRAFEIAAQPWLIQTDDVAATAFLRSLCGTGGDSAATLSDTANDAGKTAQEALLWAVPVTGDIANSEGGTAYVVSAEAYKRLVAHRYTGG